MISSLCLLKVTSYLLVINFIKDITFPFSMQELATELQ